jgi:hypothetical protein
MNWDSPGKMKFKEALKRDLNINVVTQPFLG